LTIPTLSHLHDKANQLIVITAI